MHKLTSSSILKMKTVLFWMISALLLIFLITLGWYMIRLFATSEYSEQEWRKDYGEEFTIVYKSIDAEYVLDLKAELILARKQIESFFDNNFLHPFTFQILPDRAELDAQWRVSFNQPWFISICWMVGTGSAKTLSILSPREWAIEDCGHDPTNDVEIYKLIVHELTHSYHDQINPSEDIGVYENIGWLIEGVAVYVSNQLEGQQLSSPIEAVRNGQSPLRLEDAWSGKYKYAVSGSLVKYIDEKWGRKTLAKILQYTTEVEILNELQVFEDEFLSGWKAYVLEGN